MTTIKKRPLVKAHLTIIGYGWYGQSMYMEDTATVKFDGESLFAGELLIHNDSTDKELLEDIESFISLHSGDFQDIEDFTCTLETNTEWKILRDFEDMNEKAQNIISDIKSQYYDE